MPHKPIADTPWGNKNRYNEIFTTAVWAYVHENGAIKWVINPLRKKKQKQRFYDKNT